MDLARIGFSCTATGTTARAAIFEEVQTPLIPVSVFGSLWLGAWASGLTSERQRGTHNAARPRPPGVRPPFAARPRCGNLRGVNEQPVKPFRIDVSDDVLEDLRSRLARTRWAEAECVDDWSQGIPVGLHPRAGRLLGQAIRLATS